MADTKISAFPVAGTVDRVNDALAIVQSGTSKKISPMALLDGGPLITVGDPNGAPLIAGSVFQSIVGRDYPQLTGFRIWVGPSGSITISIRKKSFASLPPTSGDKISGSTGIVVASAVSAQSDDLSSWSSTSLAKTDGIQIVIDSVSNVSWFSLLLLSA